jgi:hypothetical protein
MQQQAEGKYSQRISELAADYGYKAANLMFLDEILSSSSRSSSFSYRIV